jgi:hypothetical protein
MISPCEMRSDRELGRYFSTHGRKAIASGLTAADDVGGAAPAISASLSSLRKEVGSTTHASTVAASGGSCTALALPHEPRQLALV